MNIHHPVKTALSIQSLRHLLQSPHRIELKGEIKQRINQCHQWMMDFLQNTKDPVYGINTGFGSLCNVEISSEKLDQLQQNLLLSHACGTGALVPETVSRLMLLLKIEALSKAYSGVSVDLIESLIYLYNEGYMPVVYEQGSLGASGDLAPLAHLALPLLGRGEVQKDGKIFPAENIGMPNHRFAPKEGLALINGTQFMSAYGMFILLKSEKLFEYADRIAAMSLEAFDGRTEPFLPFSHNIRPHRGQQKSAAMILEAIQGSEIMQGQKAHVQDPYSFRCIPQVHGASRDVFERAQEVFETEINSVTDNPNVFMDEGKILSAGNFHGQPLALQLDFMAIALSEIGSISERRIYKLMEGQRGLPAFLAKESGLNSGFMIAQYTAASIASQNKQYCNPSSADSLVSSNGQEDHVSMGANAATKCLKVLDNVVQILAIEAMCAAQALEFRRPLQAGPSSELLWQEIRSLVPFLEQDDYMHPHFIQLKEWLNNQLL